MTCSGVETILGPYVGKSIWVLPKGDGSAALVKTSLIAVAGNYLYFSASVAGFTTAVIFYPPSASLIRKEAPGKYSCFSTGDKNLVVGERSTAVGSWNSVSGLASFSMGVSNVSAGDFSLVAGVQNVEAGGSNYIFGLGNAVSDQGNIAIGNSNKITSQFNVVVGDLNTISTVSNFVVGFSNSVSGQRGFVVGKTNKVFSDDVVIFGRGNEVNSKEAIIFGNNLFLADDPANEEAVLIVQGDKSDREVEVPFAFRRNKKVLNPLYSSALDSGNKGVDSNGERQYISEMAFSFEMNGHFLLKTKKITNAAGNVILDHDRYARWDIQASSSVNLLEENFQDGDIGYLVLRGSSGRFVFPASWCGIQATWSTLAVVMISVVDAEVFFVVVGTK